MKKFITIQGLFLAVVLPLSAQKIDSALNVLATQHPSEKIYIHYDKDYYVAGETIWFKTYLYSDGKPSNISSNLYLQFADSRGNIIFNKRYPVLGAVAKGNIDIPDSLPEGNYIVRALTPGMLDDDEAFIYKRNIFIFRPATTTAISSKQSQNVSLQFFPESGNLVDGILTVVAFQAVDQWGTPVEVKGVIRTEDGIIITFFKNYHDGIGKLQFKPQAGKKYIAEIETAAGLRSYPLPMVQLSGINLKIQDEKGGKKFQLSRSEKGKENFDEVTIVVQLNNHVVYENGVSFEDYPSVIGHLGTDGLPSGILRFTVFNKKGIPLAERLSFIDNGEYKSDAIIDVTKFSAEKRAANECKISFPDSLQRSCSVAVTDISGISLDDNIWSRFLLTSDLKGYIHNPAWYFVNQNDTTKEALDNLMLTHGWSRFNWIKNSANKISADKYEDSYLINISGIVYPEKDKKPVEGGKLNVFISTEDSSLYTYDIPVNEMGKFLIDSLIITGKTKIYYTYKDKKGKEKSVSVQTDENTFSLGTSKIISGFPDKYPFVLLQDSKIKDIDRRYAFAQNGNPDAKLLENVTVTTKQKRPVDIINEKYTSDIFRTGGKIKIDNINDPPVDKSINGLDFVLNRIPTIGVQYGTFVNRKNFSLQDNKEKKNTIQGPKTTISGLMRFWEVGLFINEIPADLVQLQSLRADQIAMVKFFEAGALGAGSVYPGGAIAVYLNYETVIPKKEEKKSRYIEYDGYSISKEFYSPDYSVPGTNSNKSDNRTTLYWNPEILADHNSKSVKLIFFNNDYSKQFKIVVEGFDSLGRLIHIEKIVGD